MARTRLLAVILAVASLLLGNSPPANAQGQSTPTGFAPPSAVVAQTPTGAWQFLYVDSSGNLRTAGSGSPTAGQSPPTGFVPAYGLVAQMPSGVWSFLKVDANGNLLTSGSATALAALTDVSINSPAADDSLAYSGSVWANVSVGLPSRADNDGTVVIATTDKNKVVNAGHATANAVSILQAGVAAGNGFIGGFQVIVCTTGAGVTTITPAISTINGAATLVLQLNDCARIYVPTEADTNYRAIVSAIPSPGVGASTITVANEGTTGTTLNKLAKLTGAPSTAIIGSTTDTAIGVGIVTAGAGTTGSATVTVDGVAACVFDGATTAGNFVTRSGTNAGNCADAGSTIAAAAGTGVIGIVLSTNAATGTYNVLLKPDLRNVFGTANQVLIAGTAGGGIQLSLPQSIATTSAVTFSTITSSGNQIMNNAGAIAGTTSGVSSTLRGFDAAGTTITGTTTVRGGENTNTTSNNSAPVLVRGGDNPSTGTGTGGTATTRGGDLSGVGTGAAGTLTLRGGDTVGTGAGGAASLRPGGSSNATPSNPGQLQISQTFKVGAGARTANSVACFSADYAVDDCSTTATNTLGVFTQVTNPAIVQISGLVTVNYDATVTPSAGWFACRSAITAGKVTAQSAACTLGVQVGIIAAGGTNVTSGVMLIQKN